MNWGDFAIYLTIGLIGASAGVTAGVDVGRDKGKQETLKVVAEHYCAPLCIDGPFDFSLSKDGKFVCKCLTDPDPLK